MSSLEVSQRAVVYDAAAHPTQPRIAYFTSLCRLASGDLLCGYQAGPAKHAPHNTVYFSRSRDEGRSWSPEPFEFATEIDGAPGSLAAAELLEVERGRLLCFTTWFDRSDPDRPLYNPETEGILRSKQLVCESQDDGVTWGPWREIATHGLTGCATTGPAISLPNGLIVAAFESFKEYDDPKPATHGAWVVTSSDGGRTFGEPLLVARDPQNSTYYWDQRLCSLNDGGRAAALFWTHDRHAQRDRRIHFTTLDISADSIEAAPIVETTMPGQIAAPALLADGRLLAFAVNREPPGELTLWQSTDGGATWPADQRLVVHRHQEQAVTQGLENIDFDEYWEDMQKWTFGHPALLPLDEQRVLAAYYAGEPGCMSIHACTILT